MIGFSYLINGILSIVLLASREASPARAPHQHTNGESIGALTNGHHHQSSAEDVLHEALTVMNGNGGDYHNGHTTEQSDDEYIDTIDDYDTHSFHSDAGSSGKRVAVPAVSNGHNHTSRPKVRQGQETAGRAGSQVMPASPLEVDLRFHNVLTQLNMTVERINMDVQLVMQRMVVMERTLNDHAVKVSDDECDGGAGGIRKWLMVNCLLYSFLCSRGMRWRGEDNRSGGHSGSCLRTG